MSITRLLFAAPLLAAIATTAPARVVGLSIRPVNG
jgi:hypothetical protein